MRYCLLLLTLAFLVSAQSAVVWQRWETRFPVGRRPEVTVRFVGPAGAAAERPAFREGSEWVVRYAFPRPGNWQWMALTGEASGSVSVSRYEGDNPLYRHGFLRVSASKRHLSYADGVPFFWLGDTAWFAIRNANAEEWLDYLEDRVSKGFSVIQMSIVRMLSKDNDVPVFSENGDFVSGYWQEVEDKVEAANQAGLVMFLVGPARPKNPVEEGFVCRPEFARELAARLGGNHVIFSPSFDQLYAPILDVVGNNLRPHLPDHLITQHPGTRKGQNELYGSRPYLDFHAVQTGHHNGLLPLTYGAAREWPTAMRRQLPRRPVINVEAMYDGQGTDEGTGWRGADARRLGWISWLAGAMGYTYGAGETSRKIETSNGGVWGWHQNPDSWDFWRKAMAWPSSGQMRLMRAYLERIPWWLLEPAPELLAEADGDHISLPLAAQTADGHTTLVYTPAGHHFRLQVPAKATCQWLNPREEGSQPAACQQGSTRFDPPTRGEDWLLLVSAP